MAGPLDLINRAPSSRAAPAPVPKPAAPRPAPKPKTAAPLPAPKPKMATPSPAPAKPLPVPVPKKTTPPPAPTLPVPVPAKPPIPPPEKPPAPVTPTPATPTPSPNRPLPNPSVEVVGQTEPVYQAQPAAYSPEQQAPPPPPPPPETAVDTSTAGTAPGLYAAGNAPQVTVERADPASFMNPFIEQAMEPTLRSIRDNFDRNRSRLGATAAASGAFGDDRHNMLTDKTYVNEGQQLADTFAQMMAGGYGQAMSDANQHANRMLQGSTTNAGLQDASLSREWQSNEAAAGRDLNWNSLLMQLDQQEKDRALNASTVGNSIDLAQQNQLLNLAQQQFGADNYIRGWDQLGKNANFEQWLMRQQWPAQQLAAARGSASSVPSSMTQSSTGWPGLLGSLLGSGGLFDGLF